MTHPVDVYVGKRIRHRRWLLGMTQQQLADMMVVSRSAVSMWELGTRLPDVSMILQLAD